MSVGSLHHFCILHVILMIQKLGLIVQILKVLMLILNILITHFFFL